MNDIIMKPESDVQSKRKSCSSFDCDQTILDNRDRKKFLSSEIITHIN